MTSAQRWMRGFIVDAEKIQRNAAGIGSIMGSMGIGGVAAAGGVAALVGSIKALGDRTIDLAAVSRETGVAATQLRVLQNAAKELHVDPDAITKGVVFLTGELAKARRGYGELYGLLNQVEPEFMRKIMNEDPAKAMDDVLQRLARIPSDYVRAGRSLADGIAAQKEWTAALLGDQGLGRLVEQGPQALATALQNAAKNTAPITKEMIAAAEAMSRSINDFNQSLDNLQTKAGPELFRQLEQGVRDFSAAFGDIQKAAEWVVKAREHPAEAAKELAGAVAEGAKEKAGEIAGRWSDPNFDAKRDGTGLFNPGASEAVQSAKLSRMQAELAEAEAKLKADTNPAGFPTREADTIARVRELRDAINSLRGAPSRSGGSSPEGGLLHRSAYIEGEDDGPRRGGTLGGLTPNAVMLWRELIASGTKQGFLLAAQELSGGAGDELGGSGGGGLQLASLGGGGGGGAGSERYRSAGGRSFGGSAAEGGGSFGDPSKSLLDFIAKSEGGGYNVSWGNGRFMPGGHEQNLTGKTLNEILALGNYMRQQPGSRNSSAMGRYQITGSTLRDLMKRLGLNGSEKYDEAMQDRLASKLIADEGPRALQRWEGLKRGGRMATALGLLRSGQIAPQPAEASTSATGPRGAYPEWMDQRSRHELAGINAPLARDLLAASEATGMRFRVNQGLRTPQEAAHNAATGRGVRNSQHLWGAAADIVLLDREGREIRDRAAYQRFARVYTAHSRAHGGRGRWLGDSPGRWGSDIVHFDQGIGYGQTHAREPYGEGGPTKEDIAKGNAEIYNGPDNPFLRKRPLTEPRKSLFQDGGLGGGPVRIEHSGGAVVELRGLPDSKGVKVKTEGMIAAVNVRRGAPTTQIG